MKKITVLEEITIAILRMVTQLYTLLKACLTIHLSGLIYYVEYITGPRNSTVGTGFALHVRI